VPCEDSDLVGLVVHERAWVEVARRWSLLTAIITATALLFAAGAVASRGGPQILLTSADQAAARTIVLHRSDVGRVWKGGLVKPDLSTLVCPNFHPKQSDLVTTGAAESRWTYRGNLIDAEAQLSRSARMVRLDWARVIEAPGVVSCLRMEFAKNVSSHATVVSALRLAFPHVVARTAAFRIVFDVRAKGRVVREFADVIALAVKRTEITLGTVAAARGHAAVSAAEVRFAHILARRSM